MNEERKKYVELAYKKLDKSGDGKVTLEDIAALYDVTKHPSVLSGKKKAEDVYREYLNHWDTQVADGIVTLAEFQDYYKALMVV